MSEINSGFKYLCILTIIYVMTLSFANWFDPRLIKFFGIITDAGTIVFPLSYIASDLITEVYGYKHARRAIWIGFVFNIIFLLYSYFVTHLPSPSYNTINKSFDHILTMDIRIIVASIVSYLVAEPMNSFIMAKLKILTKGRLLWLRFVSSTAVASFFDSFVFGAIAFFSIISNNNLFLLIITMWLIKIIIEVICLPVSIFLSKKLKKTECLDIYDNKTNFTFFSLDKKYQDSDNICV